MKVIKYDVIALPYIGEDETTAAALIDNHSMWLKLVFTDDAPNENNQAVPTEEFKNIIATGAYKPFKKALGYIAEGHEEAVPIGTIVNMQHSNDQIVAIASVWEEEFPEDAAAIREAYAAKEPLNVSWELFYKDSTVDDNGVEWLQGISTRAVTLVNNPAYQGRTPILAVAAVWSTEYINNLPDSSFLYVESGGKKDSSGKTTPRSLRHLPYKDGEGNVDNRHLRNAISRASQIKLKDGSKISGSLATKLQEKARKILARVQEGKSNMEELEKLQKSLEKVQAEKAELEDTLKETKAEGQTALDELIGLRTEVESLREFKTQVEEEKVRAELIKKRLGQFTEAGIEMTEEQFLSDSERWLGLDDEAFEFVLKALVNTPGSSSEASLRGDGDAGEDNDEGPKSIFKEFLESRNQEE